MFFQKLWFCTKVGASAAAFGMIFIGIGAVWFSSHTIEAQTITQASPDAPILQRISDCESGNGKPGSASQTGKDGQVIIHVNAPGLGYDIGKFQINSGWDVTATKMGYNLYVEKDNAAFAKWLWENKGSAPWISSAHCWSK